MNSRLHRRIFAIFSLIIAVALLAACGGGATPATQPPAESEVTADAPADAAPETTTIRIGYIPVLIYAPLFVGIERGYFADEGIELALTPLQGGSDSVVQLAAGNFDAAVGGAGAGLFNAAARGVEFTIVAPMHSERPPLTSPLVISAERTGEITSVTDLRGARVSINATGAATEYWLAQALEQNGLTFDDIELVTVAFPDVAGQLQNRSLDAAILGEPLATITQDQGLTAVLDEDFIDGFTATYLYFGQPLLENNPEAARGFLRAYLRATRDLQGDYMNEEIAQIIEQYTQVSADVVLRASPPQYDPNGRVPVEDIETLQAYFLERGVLEYDEPLDIGNYVNFTLAEEVAAELDAGE